MFPNKNLTFVLTLSLKLNIRLKGKWSFPLSADFFEALRVEWQRHRRAFVESKEIEMLINNYSFP